MNHRKIDEILEVIKIYSSYFIVLIDSSIVNRGIW